MQPSRVVAYDLLSQAIVEIRAYAATAERNFEMITVLANLIHNWPARLRDANTDADFDNVLHEAWDLADTRGRGWLRSRLGAHGLDPEAFPPPHGH